MSGGRVEHAAFGQGEDDLDVVVGELEPAVRPVEDVFERTALGVWRGVCWAEETDEEGRVGGSAGAHCACLIGGSEFGG